MDIYTTIDSPLGGILLVGDGTALTRVAFDRAGPDGARRDDAAFAGAARWFHVRPCHRVIGANGSLTGYAFGVPRKHALLTLEGALQPQLV